MLEWDQPGFIYDAISNMFQYYFKNRYNYYQNYYFLQNQKANTTITINFII